MSLQRKPTRFGLDSCERQRFETRPSDDPLPTGLDSESADKSSNKSTISQDNTEPLDGSENFRERREVEPEVDFQGHHSQRVIAIEDGAVVNMSTCSSSWKNLKRHFILMLNDPVIIASQGNARLVAVREFSGRDAAQKIQMLRRICNTQFLSFLDCFSSEGSRYVVFEHEISREEKFSITLRQFSLIAPYPTERQLATILGQVRMTGRL